MTAAAAAHVCSTSRPSVWPAFVAEGLTSVGSSLLMIGIFFYATHHFGWGLVQNLSLAAGQGVTYVLGALSTDWAARRLGRRRLLVALLATGAAVALSAALASSPLVVAAVLCLYTYLTAAVWPALESLVTSGVDARTLSRRVGIYNLVWSAVNAAMVAVSGLVIEHWPPGLFMIPVVAHTVAAGLMLAHARGPAISPVDAPAHAAPEPELLRARTLALWLSRISLPATYVVQSSLMAIMPLLPVMEPLDTSARTLVASTWMAARWLTFVLLGVTTWWHTRPRVLLVAAAAMLVAFLGITNRASSLPGFEGVPHSVDLAAMVGWQLALGFAIGLIYSGSLYFGMVLSHGSTEHGGYHEALIGLGAVLGPGIGALTQWWWPGDVTAGVGAVGSVVAVTVAAAAVAAVRARSRDA
jgi:MFS family permease